MTAPAGDYATWSDWLDRFGRGEVDEVDGLPSMQGEVLGAAAAQRFARRCGDAFDARMKLWSRRLERDLARVRTPHEQAVALVGARAALAPIRRFAETPLILEELRSGLRDAFRASIAQMQNSLEDQAAHAPLSVREATLRVVRQTPLTRALDGDCAPHAPHPALDTLSAPGPRRILFTPQEGHGG